MMEGFRICWPSALMILILSVSWCCNLSEARHHRQKPAVVVGAVYCDTCFQDENIKGSHYISGATVAVKCAEGSSRPAFYQEVKTDKQGNFKVELPFSVSKHVKKIEGCNVKLVKSSEPYCAVASTATSSLIHLKERKGGKHVYSAGFFTFKPLKQPGLCNKQPSVTRSPLTSLEDVFDPQFPTYPTTPEPQFPTFPTTPDRQIPTFPAPNPPTLTEPNVPFMPYLPRLPSLPPLPPLPKLPPLPFMPPVSMNPETPIGPFKDNKVQNGLVTQPQQIFPPIIPPIFTPPQGPIPLPPNPLQPPPLIPNPFQPPAPPLIPNPFQPPSPPPSLLPPTPPLPFLPPIPGLTPTPSPSPPPSLLPPTPPLPSLPPIPGLTPTPSPSPPPASSFPFPPIIPLPPRTPLIPGFPPVKVKKVNP